MTTDAWTCGGMEISAFQFKSQVSKHKAPRRSVRALLRPRGIDPPLRKKKTKHTHTFPRAQTSSSAPVRVRSNHRRPQAPCAAAPSRNIHGRGPQRTTHLRGHRRPESPPQTHRTARCSKRHNPSARIAPASRVCPGRCKLLFPPSAVSAGEVGESCRHSSSIQRMRHVFPLSIVLQEPGGSAPLRRRILHRVNPGVSVQPPRLRDAASHK